MRSKKKFVTAIVVPLLPVGLDHVADARPARVPVDQPGAGFLLEREKVQSFAQQPVISLPGLLQELQVPFQGFGIGKHRPVYPLQRMVLFVAFPVGSGHAEQLEVLEQPGRGQMGPAAQIDKIRPV